MAMMGGSTSETQRFTNRWTGCRALAWPKLDHFVFCHFDFVLSFYILGSWPKEYAHDTFISIGRFTTEYSCLWVEFPVVSKPKVEAINFHQAFILVANDKEEKEQHCLLFMPHTTNRLNIRYWFKADVQKYERDRWGDVVALCFYF